MNTKNIQTFLMVSAAFFAMSAPVRSSTSNAGALSNVVTRPAEVTPATVALGRVSRPSQSDHEDQNS